MSSRSRVSRAGRTAVAAVGAGALVAAMTAPVAAHEVVRDKQPMHDFATGKAIPGAYSVLKRIDDDDHLRVSDAGNHEDRVRTKIRTYATAKHAVTLWYVAFNHPDQCNTEGCGEDDIFVDGDMSKGFDLDQIAKAGVSVVYGGDGGVVNKRGKLKLRGGLSEDEVPTGKKQVVIGHPDDGAMVPSTVTGIKDVEATEIHIVLQDHGKARKNPKKLDHQLTRFHGACNPECVDIQFAVHK